MKKSMMMGQYILLTPSKIKLFDAFYFSNHINEILAKQPPKAILGCYSTIGPVKFKKKKTFIKETFVQ